MNIERRLLNTDSAADRAFISKRLPFIPEVLLTWASGVPASGEKPATWSQQGRIAVAMLQFFTGLFLATWGTTLGWVSAFLAVLVGWSLAIGAARYLQLTVYHYAAHGAVISKKWSERIGRMIATMLLIQPFDAYAPQHQRAHHGRQTVSTNEDPTVQMLRGIVGIEPGVCVAKNKQRFFRTLASQAFHISATFGRLKMHFGGNASWKLRLSAALWLSVLLGATSMVFGFWAMVIGIVLPMTVGYQAAQLARLIVEHMWPAGTPKDGKRSKSEHDALTIAIHGIPMPPQVWTSRTSIRFAVSAAANLWIRAVVLPGDSGPNHNWHHGEARGDWANHITAAAIWREKQAAKGYAQTSGAWGYFKALQLALESFAHATPDSLQVPNRPRTGGTV